MEGAEREEKRKTEGIRSSNGGSLGRGSQGWAQSKTSHVRKKDSVCYQNPFLYYVPTQFFWVRTHQYKLSLTFCLVVIENA